MFFFSFFFECLSFTSVLLSMLFSPSIRSFYAAIISLIFFSYPFVMFSFFFPHVRLAFHVLFLLSFIILRHESLFYFSFYLFVMFSFSGLLVSHNRFTFHALFLFSFAVLGQSVSSGSSEGVNLSLPGINDGPNIFFPWRRFLKTEDTSTGHKCVHTYLMAGKSEAFSLINSLRGSFEIDDPRSSRMKQFSLPLFWFRRKCSVGAGRKKTKQHGRGEIIAPCSQVTSA